MKKLINSPEDVVIEFITGLGAAFSDLVKIHTDPNYIIRADAPVAMTLISTVGGASGALYGTFSLQATSLAASKTELSPAEFGALLDKGLAGIVSRGKAAVGDKTMVDALQPGIKAYKRSVEAGEPLKDALAAALNAAEEGLKSTIPLVARKGRASYLGERSAGHPDPGAASTVLLFRSAAESPSYGGIPKPSAFLPAPNT